MRSQSRLDCENLNKSFSFWTTCRFSSFLSDLEEKYVSDDPPQRIVWPTLKVPHLTYSKIVIFRVGIPYFFFESRLYRRVNPLYFRLFLSHLTHFIKVGQKYFLRVGQEAQWGGSRSSIFQLENVKILHRSPLCKNAQRICQNITCQMTVMSLSSGGSYPTFKSRSPHLGVSFDGGMISIS